MGTNMLTGGMVCCDPISWFQSAKLISSPSVFVLGKVGLGKSTCVRRMLLGLNGFGVTGLVLGDTKPDHAALVEAMGGKVIRLGRGRGGRTPARDVDARPVVTSRLERLCRSEIAH
jgi:hypothetical protein